MQVTRVLALAALGSTALCTVAFAAPPPTVQVGGCRKNLTNYSTISMALGSVPPGYTIDVCPGDYPEQITVTQSVTITGVEANGANLVRLVVPAAGFAVNATDPDQNNQPVAAQIVISGGATVTINNMTIDGSGGNFRGSCATDLVGVLIQNAMGTLQNSAVINTNLNDPNLFGCQDGLAVLAQSSGTGSTFATITGNYVDGFQKNGITADDKGTVAVISGNTVLGVGPTNAIAQNSIQVGFSANANVSSNDVGDDVYTPTPDSAGVLVYDSTGTTASNNVVTNADYAIAVVADTMNEANKPTVSSNEIETAFDAIDICGSSGGNVNQNMTDGIANGAIHIDASCQLPTSLNSAANNRINQACAGVLEGSGTTFTSSLTTDTFLSVANNVLTGTDTCSATDALAHHATHVSVFR